MDPVVKRSYPLFHKNIMCIMKIYDLSEDPYRFLFNKRKYRRPDDGMVGISKVIPVVSYVQSYVSKTMGTYKSASTLMH